MHLVFNELSLLNDSIDKNQSEKIFDDFIKTYSHAVGNNIGFSRELITTVDLNNIEISKGYFAVEWRNSKTGDKDLQIRYKRICDLQKIQTYGDSNSELTYNGYVGNGLLIAYQDDLFTISLNSNICWNNYFIECDYYMLDTDETTTVQLRNFSNVKIIDDNLKDISSIIQAERMSCTTPEELLKNIDSLFPSLLFHQNVLNQIKNQLEKQYIPVVCKKLSQLEQYFSVWDGKVFDQNKFPNRSVSPQSNETLKRFEREHTYDFNDKSVLVRACSESLQFSPKMI